VHGSQWGKHEEPEVVMSNWRHKPAQQWRMTDGPKAEPDHRSEGSPKHAEWKERGNEHDEAKECREIQCRLHQTLYPGLTQPFDLLARISRTLRYADGRVHNYEAEAIEDHPQTNRQNHACDQQGNGEEPCGNNDPPHEVCGFSVSSQKSHCVGIRMGASLGKLLTARLNVFITVVPKDRILAIRATHGHDFSTDPTPLAATDLASHVVTTAILHRLPHATRAILRPERLRNLLRFSCQANLVFLTRVTPMRCGMVVAEVSTAGYASHLWPRPAFLVE
jgi:hypothetical protein